jgi:hypothetical protein
MNPEFRKISLFVISFVALILSRTSAAQATQKPTFKVDSADSVGISFELNAPYPSSPQSGQEDMGKGSIFSKGGEGSEALEDVEMLTIPDQGAEPPVGFAGSSEAEIRADADLPPPPDSRSVSSTAVSSPSAERSEPDSRDDFENREFDRTSDTLAMMYPRQTESTSSQTSTVVQPRQSQHAGESGSDRAVSGGILDFDHGTPKQKQVADSDARQADSRSQHRRTDASQPERTATLSVAPPSPVHLPAELEELFTGGVNSLVARAVGSAEGTRTPDGGKTPAYSGHVDPGNRVWNLGTFSYQHGASSPEKADEKQLKRLRWQTQMLNQQAQAQGISLDLEAQLNGIDLANQAPLAALGRGGYVERLKQAYDMGLRGSEAIVWARTRSFLDPDTRRWNAPGLGNTIDRITADQDRRRRAIARAIETNVQLEAGDRPLEFQRSDNLETSENTEQSESQEDSIIDQILSLDLF